MNTKKHSKRLSYILRHAPEEAGLTLGDGGWVQVRDLIAGFAAKDWAISVEELQTVVETNDKKRFTFNEDKTQIRAAQGHSVKVEIGLMPVSPPETLYHGTATRFVDVIMQEGLKPMSRQHVHLSADVETASKVGARHGKLAILIVQTGEMHTNGSEFFQADNGVWLTEYVPPNYLTLA